jgi:hypothetical protein
MTENTPRVISSRVTFVTRFAIVLLAIAAACLGLVTLHSTVGHQTAHSHQDVSAPHSHSDVASTDITTAGSADSSGSHGFLAPCEGCALGTVTPAAGATLLLLLLLSAVFLMRSPAVFARLIDRGQQAIATLQAVPRSITPPPVALGISRT